MPVDASPGDFESALKPLWLRAQSGDDAAYRQCLGLLATRLRGYSRSGAILCRSMVDIRERPLSLSLAS